ncbi:hypothetical protein ACFRAI_22225 [Streptomyces sp. NPDC056637]|uniref:hypothetical protein n=1 Tax=unclassified Streptomyces TaxID=2593676 RepID=UPI0036C112BE
MASGQQRVDGGCFARVRSANPQHCPPHTDPVYNGVLEPLFRLAEEVPYDITRMIKQG